MRVSLNSTLDVYSCGRPRKWFGSLSSVNVAVGCAREMATVSLVITSSAQGLRDTVAAAVVALLAVTFTVLPAWSPLGVLVVLAQALKDGSRRAVAPGSGSGDAVAG